jgi:hypothetical protein
MFGSRGFGQFMRSGGALGTEREVTLPQLKDFAAIKTKRVFVGKHRRSQPVSSPSVSAASADQAQPPDQTQPPSAESVANDTSSGDDV